MDAAWEALREETTDIWGSLQASSSRLQAALNLIHRNREQSKSLKPVLDGILVLLEASQSVHQVDALALDVLVALDHWVTALDLWPRWEVLLRHYVQVARQHERHDVIIILLHYLAVIVQQGGRAAEALDTAAQGLAMADQTTSPHITGQILIKVVWMALSMNAMSQAWQALETTKLIYDSLPLSDQTILLGYMLCAGADYARRNGHLLEAVRLAGESMRLFEQDPHAHAATQATVYRMVGVYEWAYGNHHNALKSLKKAVRLYRVLGDQFGVAWVYGNQGLVYRYLGQLQKAEMVTKRGIVISRHYGAHWQIVFETGNLADIYLLAGHTDHARRWVVRHWVMARKLNIRSEIMRSMGNMAFVNIQRGRYRSALRALWADFKYSKSDARFESLALVCGGLSQCYRHLNHPWRAQVLGYASLHLSRRIQSKRSEIMALRVLAECLPPDQAYECLQQALVLTDFESFEQTACEVSLLPYIEDETERSHRWMILHDRLVEMGCGVYLFDCDHNHLPRLVVSL